MGSLTRLQRRPKSTAPLPVAVTPAAASTIMASLREILPERLSTARMTLELFDYSTPHYQCLLAAMNSPTAHARMGDFGIRTPAEFDKLNHATRLTPETLGKKPGQIRVDIDVYYLLRLKTTVQQTPVTPVEGALPLIGGLIGGVSLVQRGPDLPPDIGWCILEQYHGNGYAAEAASVLRRLATQALDVKEIMAWPGSANLASVRVAEKVGLVRGGTIGDLDGKEHIVYVLPGMDFQKLANKKLSLFGG